MRNFLALIMFWVSCLPTLAAAETDLTISTVTRPPFSMLKDGEDTGFSIDLFNAVTEIMHLTVSYDRKDSFGGMLDAVQDGSVDGAIANISITASREEVMDFTQPIFDSGVQVMLPTSASAGSGIFAALFTKEIGLMILGALVLLSGGGMLMWVFERRHQPYFDHSAKDAAFPAFWWALNVVVNGGFEERQPKTRGGRFFGTILVISSLFIVSIFVAQITAALTVNAIQNNIESITDLDGKRVGTIDNSTSATYLESRGIGFIGSEGLEEMLAEFEAGKLDAVVFDGPILAYYVRFRGQGKAQLLERVYRPESYGMVFSSGSVHQEEVDRAILTLRENGIYDQLLLKWFGNAYVRR